MKLLKIIWILLFLLPLSNKMEAQKLRDKSHKMYVGGGGGYGFTNTLFGINANYIAKNRWGINWAYRTNIRGKARNLPQDYKAGLCFSFEDCDPNDYSRSISLSVIRDFPLQNSAGSATIELGPSLVRYRQAHFARRVDQGLSFGSNYNTTYIGRVAPGIHLRASRIFRTTTALSIQIAATANLNKLNSFFGFELYFLMGDLNN